MAMTSADRKSFNKDRGQVNEADEKIDFITGTGMRIGRAACLLFAIEGATIIAVDIDQNAGTETVDQIKKMGKQGIFMRCDVGVDEDVKSAIEKDLDTYQRLDILFNNAGVLWRDENLEVIKTDEAV